MRNVDLSTSNNLTVDILENMVQPNATGYCLFQLKNHGPDIINITSFNLSVAYYNETLQIQDIQAKVNGNATTGIKTGEELVNVTVTIANSLNTSYSGTLWLNITNSSGDLINYSSQLIDVPLNSSGNQYNFTDINTSTWNEDTYNLTTYFINDSISSKIRTETLLVSNILLTMNGMFSSELNDNYHICSQTTEEFNVTIDNPFNDKIEYNVTLEEPSGWSYSPSYQLINTTSSGNYTLFFNITSR